MSVTIFSTIYGAIDSVIVSTVTSGYGAVSSYASQALIAGIGVYIVVACYAVLRGIAGEGFGHVLTQAVKASLVLALVQGNLGGVTALSVMQWPEALAGMAGSGTGNPGQIADTLFNKIQGSVAGIIDPLSNEMATANAQGLEGLPAFLSLGIIILIVSLVSLVPLLIAGVLGAVITVMLLFLKFGLAVAALFGPIFVALLLFDSTRGMFFTWLTGALSYALGTVVIGLAIRVVNQAILGLVDGEAARLADLVAAAPVGNFGGIIVTALGGLLIISVILIVAVIFIMQASSIAQGLAGGGGGSSGAVAGALIPSNYTVRSAVGALRSGTGNLVGGSLKAGKGAVNAGGKAVGAAQRAASNLRTMRGQGTAALSASTAAAL